MLTTLIQLELPPPHSRRCDGWSTISSDHVTQIVVTASPTPLACASAEALHDALRWAMRSAGGAVEVPPCGGNLPVAAQHCRAVKHRGPVRRLVVWVADATATNPVVPPTLSCWDEVLIVLAPGTPVGAVPSALQSKVLVWISAGTIEQIVPDVLALAGIIVDGFRVFISYRWEDCQAFAEQLFTALAKHRFDVFLDRFRTPPGQNFVQRIRHELSDKACLVLLDSAQVDQSSWVREEHAVARQHRLGLFAVDLPGGGRQFPTIHRRIDLRSALPTPLGRDETLDPSLVQQTVDTIRAGYLAETARRARYQRRIIQSAATTTGVMIRNHAGGLVEAQSRYLVSAHARPPATAAFRRLEIAARGRRLRPVAVGLLDAQLQQAHADCSWLARRIGGVAVDERRLYRSFQRIKAGTL